MAGYEAWRHARAVESTSTSVSASVPGVRRDSGARSSSSSRRTRATRARRYASRATSPTIRTCASASGTRRALRKAPSRWRSRRRPVSRGSW